MRFKRDRAVSVEVRQLVYSQHNAAVMDKEVFAYNLMPSALLGASWVVL